MRLRPALILAAVFVLAALLAWTAARILARTVETRSVEAVAAALAAEGHDWAEVIGDGLQIVLQGTAPTEAARFRAMTAAGSVVDASRVIDNLAVTPAAGLLAPQFAIEILRNDSGVSLVGLIPAATDREALSSLIAEAAGGRPVADLLQTADYPVPEDWQPALDYALRAMARLPRSKISVRAGEVAVTAIATTREERQRLESELARIAPPAVGVDLTINAPRPVVTPFTLRFVIDDTGARFDACTADTEAARDAILAAAVAAGTPAGAGCTLALGVPTASWGQAAARAIAALAELGGGTVTFSDADVTLLAAAGTDPAVFDRVAGELDNALPEVFALDAAIAEATGSGTGPVAFSAVLAPEGQVTLRGRVADALMNDTTRTFAQANFGADKVTMGTRVEAEGLPVGWSVRVLAGLEALATLAEGRVEVLPDRITLTGRSGDPEADDTVSRMFIERLGRDAAFDLAITYDAALDPAAALPTPEECVARVTAATDARKITFDPGSATLSAQGLAVLDEVAGILRDCADLRLRIAGYTDSQGRDETNLALSQARAEAVLDALRARRVPVAGFEAVGYGEADPIADNATDAGREANRRIEMTALGAAPAAAEAPAEALPGAGSGGPAAVETRPQARPEGLAPDGAAGEDGGG